MLLHNFTYILSMNIPKSITYHKKKIPRACAKPDSKISPILLKCRMNHSPNDFFFLNMTYILIEDAHWLSVGN